jgi:hypothetical protein
MKLMRLCLAAVLALMPTAALGQDDVLAARVMTAVRAALAPALPYPASDELGSLPADGKAHDPWMVRPWQPGDRTIEVLANPLNEAHQRRAAKAMEQIEQSIEAAQRRADVQFERAIAEARRTGRSQEVDGVTLSDEGLAGARIDAESHVTIEVLFNQPTYRFNIASALAPDAGIATTIANARMVSVRSNVYRDQQGDERLCEGESIVFVGSVTAPEVRRVDDAHYEVTASATPSSDIGKPVNAMVLRMRGNEVLIADLLRKSDWSALLVELLK